jgi:streptogramin lyase
VPFFLTLVALGVFVSAAAAKPGPPPPGEALVVQTGGAPCGTAVHGAELWVGVYEAGAVLRLDRAGRIRQRLRLGPWACRVAVDERAVWVTRDRADAVVRVDRSSGRRRTVEVASPFDLALAAGALWVTSFDTGTVTRIDPRTARRTRLFEVGGNPAGITACGGSIWIGHGRAATWLTAIDPRTGGTRRVDVVVESPGWPRCVRGELWVTTADAVLQVSPRSGSLRSHYSLGGTPAEANAARGMVWVTDKERSVVHRIDPVSKRVVDSFPAGPGAYSIARFAGSMWITSFAGSDIRRYDP